MKLNIYFTLVFLYLTVSANCTSLSNQRVVRKHRKSTAATHLEHKIQNLKRINKKIRAHSAAILKMKADIMGKLKNFKDDKINEIADKILDIMYEQDFTEEKLKALQKELNDAINAKLGPKPPAAEVNGLIDKAKAFVATQEQKFENVIGSVSNPEDLKSGLLAEQVLFQKKFDRIYKCFFINKNLLAKQKQLEDIQARKAKGTDAEIEQAEQTLNAELVVLEKTKMDCLQQYKFEKKNCGKDKEYLRHEIIFNSITENIPPGFCWKDYLAPPKACPATHPLRKMELCYKTCRQQKPTETDTVYEHTLGVCWETCDKPSLLTEAILDIDQVAEDVRAKNQKDKCNVSGLEVFTDWPENKHFSWCALKFDCKHTRKSFVPDSLTNFNSNVQCPPGSSKSGALCYPDKVTACSEMGFSTCGPAACAINTRDCVGAIATMVFKTIKAAVQITLLATTLGATSYINMIGNLQITAGTFDEISNQIAKTKEVYIKVYEEASKTGNKLLLNKMLAKAVEAANKKFNAHNTKMDESKATDMIRLETTDQAEVQQLMDYLYLQLSEENNVKNKNTIVDVIKNIVTKNKELVTGTVKASSFDVKNLFSVDLLKDLKAAYDSTDGGICDRKVMGDREDLKIKCARSILAVVEKRDPIGLTSVAMAFMQPKCTTY